MRPLMERARICAIANLCKTSAHRRKQGDGVVTYAEPLSRSKRRICAIANLRKTSAHRKKQGDGVVTYAEPLSRSKRGIAQILVCENEHGDEQSGNHPSPCIDLLHLAGKDLD